MSLLGDVVVASKVYLYEAGRAGAGIPAAAGGLPPRPSARSNWRGPRQGSRNGCVALNPGPDGPVPRPPGSSSDRSLPGNGLWLPRTAKTSSSSGGTTATPWRWRWKARLPQGRLGLRGDPGGCHPGHLRPDQGQGRGRRRRVPGSRLPACGRLRLRAAGEAGRSRAFGRIQDPVEGIARWMIPAPRPRNAWTLSVGSPSSPWRSRFSIVTTWSPTNRSCTGSRPSWPPGGTRSSSTAISASVSSGPRRSPRRSAAPTW